MSLIVPLTHRLIQPKPKHKPSPGRRSCQANEAFGAKLQRIIRTLVCRRKAKKGKSKHTRIDGSVGAR